MKQNKKTAGLLFFTILVVLFVSFESVESYQGATSYSNAKEFYESTGDSATPYHAEMINGTIYYATSGKLANSSSNLRYHTVGFDITLSGNGHSVSFTVQRTGGSMIELDTRKDNTHEYILYAIKDSTLYDLASKANPIHANYVLAASTINVKMDAILVTKQGSHFSGGITENGSGGFYQNGTIYRLKDSSDLNALKQIFSGHSFHSYINIESEMENHLLQIQYQMQGLNSTSSTVATVGIGYSLKDGFLYKNGYPYLQNQRILQLTTLLNPNTINLRKTGYHLEDGKEWITEDRRTLSTTSTYMPQTLEPMISENSCTLTLYANWKSNTYTVKYDANGGIGTVISTNFLYDQEKSLRYNTFQKKGYYLESGAEWNTKPDGTGTSYGSGQRVKHLTANNGETLTLYANWKPIIVSITTDKQGGNGGTDAFYQKYNTGFFRDSSCSNHISSLSLPAKTGYSFKGYFENPLGIGTAIIDSKGNIKASSNYYLEDSVIYAYYKPNNYTITFDKQGGQQGSNSVTATYDSLLPNADAPVRNGYTFKGYFTQTNGKGTMYYNENMASDVQFNSTSNIVLYAYWEDETPPDVVLQVSSDTWTQSAATLSAKASDSGTGLKSLQIYRLADNGVTTLVKEDTNLNGSKSAALEYVNPSEGVIRYKAVATDMSGKTAESINVVYYDTTAPSGEIEQTVINGTSYYFKINVSDIHVK